MVNVSDYNILIRIKEFFLFKVLGRRYFISFIEECIQNPEFYDYVGGRIEITDELSDRFYATNEIRFFTNKIDEFYDFRERWDFKTVSKKKLVYIEKITEEKFCYIG